MLRITVKKALKVEPAGHRLFARRGYPVVHLGCG
jgi:hypothetical protein